MERMIGIILVCGSVLSFTLASTIREDIAVIRICNTTDSVDMNLLNEYMMYHNFNHLDSQAHHQLACFLLCIYSEYNWMDRHGAFKVHNIKSWMLKTKLPTNDIEILIEKCITPELADPCTRARHFTECFWTNQGALSANHRHTLHSIIRKKDAE